MFLEELAKQVAALSPVVENTALSITGLSIATQLNTLAQRVFGSFECYEIIWLKELHHVLSLCLGQRFDAWVGQMLKDVQSSLQRRKTMQDRILANAKGGCKPLGPVELVDNNFTLVAYHFFARGDETWLEDDCFQVVALGPLGQLRPPVECPLGDHSLYLQEWDTRDFICPSHEVPLVQKEGAISLPLDVVHTSGVQTGLYRETVTPVEDIAKKYPSKVALSLRIPKMLPFSELVIAVGETDSMPGLRRFVQDFLQGSSLREEVRRTEEGLQRSYAKLLETLRSTPTAGPEQSSGDAST
jgi:hypothetical protein